MLCKMDVILIPYEKLKLLEEAIEDRKWFLFFGGETRRAWVVETEMEN